MFVFLKKKYKPNQKFEPGPLVELTRNDPLVNQSKISQDYILNLFFNCKRVVM